MWANVVGKTTRMLWCSASQRVPHVIGRDGNETLESLARSIMCRRSFMANVVVMPGLSFVISNSSFAILAPYPLYIGPVIRRLSQFCWWISVPSITQFVVAFEVTRCGVLTAPHVCLARLHEAFFSRMQPCIIALLFSCYGNKQRTSTAVPLRHLGKTREARS